VLVFFLPLGKRILAVFSKMNIWVRRIRIPYPAIGFANEGVVGVG